jgi:hypothetical protein
LGVGCGVGIGVGLGVGTGAQRSGKTDGVLPVPVPPPVPAGTQGGFKQIDPGTGLPGMRGIGMGGRVVLLTPPPLPQPPAWAN